MTERKRGIQPLIKKVKRLIPKRRSVLRVDEWQMKRSKRKTGKGVFKEATGQRLEDILFPK